MRAAVEISPGLKPGEKSLVTGLKAGVNETTALDTGLKPGENETWSPGCRQAELEKVFMNFKLLGRSESGLLFLAPEPRPWQSRPLALPRHSSPLPRAITPSRIVCSASQSVKRG